MGHDQLHTRARTRGVNRPVYWLVRAVLQPFFHLYFRMRRIGREHIPAKGPVIVAANHRSFLDPFVIGTMARRPMYYVAKVELFKHRWQAWVLNALGAFPVNRGGQDEQMIETAKSILARGDSVLIFPEGTRTRPGSLGKPKRGVGRLALETGAPVVPVAVIGTEDVRKGWRIRPRRVRIRAGRALRFPVVQSPSPALAGAVAVLGGPSHAAEALANGASVVIGSMDPAFSRQLADALRSAGLDVTLTPDVTGVELAGCAKNAAVLAAAAAAQAGPNVAGAAAGKVFAEVDAIARVRGGRPETFAGLAGAGDLVATAVSEGCRHRRAGALPAQGVSAAEIGRALGQAAEAVDSVPLLASVARDSNLDAPALEGLAALVEGRIEPERWTQTVTQPARPKRSRRVRAA